MTDFFEQFKKHQEINEGLFDFLSKKQKIQQPQKQDSDFYQDENGLYHFGQNSTAKQVNTPRMTKWIEEFANEGGFRNSKLNYLILPGTVFHAERIDLDIKQQTVDSFNGIWESGPFIGKTFKGVFKGSSFQGNFIGPFSNYESHPTTFVEGLFLDSTKKGILGLPNTVTLDKAKNRKFNLITIPVGHYLQFRSVNGITGHIKVLKRLDYTSSDFQFEVLNGFAGDKSPRNISLPWNYFRQNWKFMEINPKNPRNIGGLIIVPEGDYIKEIYISAAPATFQTPEATAQDKFDATKEYKFDLSKLPYLNIKPGEGQADVEAKVTFNSQQEFSQYEKIVDYINNGVLAKDIQNVAKAIKFGEIDGYGPYNYLSTLFNGKSGKNVFNAIGASKKKIAEAGKGNLGKSSFTMPGSGQKTQNWRNKRKPQTPSFTVPAQVQSPQEELKFDIKDSMERLNNFMKYFVANISLADGQPNNEFQNLIINRLKTSLGTENIQPAEKQSVGKPEPGMQGGGEEGDSDIDLGDIQFKESFIRKNIRGIINDSF